MKENKKAAVFKFIFIVLFVTFSAIYIMVSMGYYEYSNYTKKVFTEEQIKKFENDIKTGKKLDINDYLVDSNEVIMKKQIGNRVSELIGFCAKGSIIGIFKFLNKIIEM